MITITAFSWVPDFAKGLVRDLRPRWALEEAELPYQVKLITHEEEPGVQHENPSDCEHSGSAGIRVVEARP